MAVVEGKRLWVKVVKEEVRRKKSEEVAVKEKTWGRMSTEPLLSKWVSPGKGASGRGSSPRELARGSAERGTVWLWGSGQEALIHPRTRSVFFFFLTKTKREKQKNPKTPNKTGVNRLMRPEQLWGHQGRGCRSQICFLILTHKHSVGAEFPNLSHSRGDVALF